MIEINDRDQRIAAALQEVARLVAGLVAEFGGKATGDPKRRIHALRMAEADAVKRAGRAFYARLCALPAFAREILAAEFDARLARGEDPEIVARQRESAMSMPPTKRAHKKAMEEKDLAVGTAQDERMIGLMSVCKEFGIEVPPIDENLNKTLYISECESLLLARAG